MPVVSTFKTCTHADDAGNAARDWRACYACIDEVATSLMIARTYLKELAEGVFNDDGDCTVPVTEPIRGQNFQRIANTALGVIS